MQVTVRAYGLLREKLGRAPVIQLPEGSRLTDLLNALQVSGDRVWIVRVNGAEAGLAQALHDGDQVELIQPVAGG